MTENIAFIEDYLMLRCRYKELNGGEEMKKLFVLLFAALVMVACGEVDSSEKEVNNLEVAENDNEVEANNDEEENSEEEFNKVIADDDFLKATLVKVEHKLDEIFDDESYVVHMTLENNADYKIVVQARDVSIDGLMVDDMVVFSEEIVEGKKANGKLDIMTFDDDLPELNDSLEFTLIVINEETFETVSEYDVSIDF